MEQDMFKPSLNSGEQIKVQTYDIRKLFYVGFFGGVIPLMGLGTKNAKWLGIKKSSIYLLISLGVLVLLVKMVVLGMISSKTIIIETRYVRYGYKFLSVSLFGGYYFVMKEKFNQYIFLNEEIKPMLKSALLWIGLGILIEVILAILVVGGSQIGRSL